MIKYQNTEAEMLKTFDVEIERMAKERSLTMDACIEKLRRTYEGYRFSADGEGVFNPYSLLTALKKRRFGDNFEISNAKLLDPTNKEVI